MTWEDEENDEMVPVVHVNNVKKITPAILEGMVHQFNQWWWDYRHMTINFTYRMDDWRYITGSEAALARNDIINLRLKAMGLTDNITILEPFAGSGADTITFLHDIHPTPKLIVACENNPSKRDLADTNVTNFKQAYKERYGVDCKTEVKIVPIESALAIYQKFDNIAIDLLYLDPPWEVKTGEGELQGLHLVKWLDKNVFQSFKDTWQKNRPKIIIIKTRFGKDEMKDLEIDGYLFVDTMDFTPFRNTVHFHTLVSTDVRTHHIWVPSEKYIKIHPYAAKANNVWGQKYAATYKIGYVNDENKTKMWHVVPNRLHGGDGPNALEDDSHAFTVVPVKNDGRNAYVVKKSKPSHGIASGSKLPKKNPRKMLEHAAPNAAGNGAGGATKRPGPVDKGSGGAREMVPADRMGSAARRPGPAGRGGGGSSSSGGAPSANRFQVLQSEDSDEDDDSDT